jgi:two-component system nitrogen regulation sensor histidine kinase NtrY
LQIKLTWKRFLKDNVYLIIAALLLLSISVFTQESRHMGATAEKFTKTLSEYIHNGEKEFSTFKNDENLIASLAKGKSGAATITDLAARKQHFFIYSETAGFRQLLFWNTQAVLPDDFLLNVKDSVGFIELSNGYYVWQKSNVRSYTVIALLPVKWNYFISNDHLKNNFVIGGSVSTGFGLNDRKGTHLVSTATGRPLFFINEKKAGAVAGLNPITIWLRLLALIPIFLFIHFCSSFIYLKKNLFSAALFLFVVLFLLRFASYVLPMPVNLRVFELFDPAVYGADMILRSLGDLLINTILFFWIISFIRARLRVKRFSVPERFLKYKWLALGLTAIILLFVTSTVVAVIKSMVADSQISFDVLQFFSLNIYSVIGFLVLCCIAISYYYFCRVLLFFLSSFFPDFLIPFCISISAGGLLLLSFKIGNMSAGFELYVLAWLLLFLLLLKNDLAGFFSGALIISKMVFWLFFFSVSITAVIITENSLKELRNRRHYAEVIAEKTDPITEVLINTMLTEFRPDMLAENFHLLENQSSSIKFKDSLVNNNFSGYTDKYATTILSYDSTEAPLYNEDATDYNSINSIYNTQAKRTSVEGLFFYDAGFDKLNYISKRIINNFEGKLLGYVFIIISPKDFNSETLYPELFSRGHDNSIENSSEYAYAVYNKGKLISSHNDYAFSTRYPDTYFAGKQYLLVRKKDYNELWYNPGGDKFVVVVKENRLMIESITLFSYLFCAFLVLSAFSWLISFLVRSQLKWYRIKSFFRLSIKQQVHGTIIFFSAISFIVIGIATILFFINRYESNNRETLSRTIRIMEEDLQRSVSGEMLQQSVFEGIRNAPPNELEGIVKNIAVVHGLDINLYTTGGDLKASSLALPYVKGILSTKMDPVAFWHLNTGREIQYLQKEKIGSLSFVSDYIPVTDAKGNDIAYLNIPYFTSQTRLQQEISNFLVTIINLNAFIFLIAGIVALIITNKITGSFSFISEKMKRINLEQANEKIIWNRNDEIGALVKEYNRMLAKLDASAAALARKERESAWQEMAKQVAHEIKNPLTPMKLSMQYLQKSIDNDAPNIKELAARVSATLVEQIDHLSTIAGEFSRFANIEKANPETFNLNDALRSVKQLHSGDQQAKFEFEILKEEVPVHADKTHVNRILTNLILNGIQAVPENKTPVIKVGERIAGSKVIISISDNGSGIDESVREKIFTPNFTTKSSGTGLGLAMCKRMAEQAGGDIRYETSAEGTTFYVTLPMLIQE